MATASIEEVQGRLGEWIDKLSPGEELIVLRGAQPVAKLARLEASANGSGNPQALPGRCQGMLTIVVEDDAHLKDWEEYMP